MNLSIGPVALQGSALLAPLASITNPPFRQICLEMGCCLAVTEMVSSEAVTRNVRTAMLRMQRAGGERVLAVQLFGGNPETMAEAATIVIEHAGADIIDVNMGCPVRKVVRCGAGVALMNDPARAASVVQAVVRSCGERVPVTVKMRAGWDDLSINAVEIAQRVEQAGASAVTVHARTREQIHSGQSRWDLVAAVKRSVGVPVVGNGAVRSAGDASAMRHQTGCDAVMIGRGALGNPWIFEAIRTGVDRAVPIAERFAWIRRHFALYVDYAGERTAALEMRKHLCWYLRSLPGNAMVRARLHAMNSPQEVLDTLSAFETALESLRERNGARVDVVPER